MKLLEKFKSIGLFATTENTTVLQEKQQISDKIDTYIKNDMLEVVLQYMNNGYSLTEKQYTNLQNGLDNRGYHGILECFVKTLANKMTIPDKLLIDNFSELSHCVYYQRDKRERFYLVTEKYKEKFENADFREKIYNNWIKEVNKYDLPVAILKHKKRSKYNFGKPVELFPEVLFADRTLDELMALVNLTAKLSENLSTKKKKLKSVNYDMKQLSGYFSSVSYAIKNYLQNHRVEDMKEEQRRVSILYAENNIEKLIEEENSKISVHESLKELPSPAKTILENIKNVYLEIYRVREDLNESEKIMVNNLWEKRIPEVVNQYLRIAPELRAKLKTHDNRPVEDLLMNSLENLQEVLLKIKTEHSERVVNDMSATNRYTKNLKNF